MDSLKLIVTVIDRLNKDIDSVVTASGTRRKRCSDRFVKYPYPKSLISNYQKDFHNKLADTKVVT